MRTLDGRALVAIAIAEPAIVAAYRDGSAPPWLAAALLGQTRSARGYDVLSAILYEAPRLLAESYAGVAMAKVRGVEPELRSCEGPRIARARD